MTKIRIERRRFVMGGASWLGLLAAGCTPRSESTPIGQKDSDSLSCETEHPKDTSSEVPADDTSAQCPPTATNIEGPFYISDSPVRNDLDLYEEDGEVLVIEGRLYDEACQPIEGGVIEVWHARPDGTYDNDSAEMAYRGQFASGSDGGWSLRTLMPGKYLNGADYRPAHIHVKVWVDGAEALTTQLYFEGDTHIASDPWAKPELTLSLTSVDGVLKGEFDIVVC